MSRQCASAMANGTQTQSEVAVQGSGPYGWSFIDQITDQKCASF